MPLILISAKSDQCQSIWLPPHVQSSGQRLGHFPVNFHNVISINDGYIT